MLATPRRWVLWKEVANVVDVRGSTIPVALRRALETFWERGYAGTSLADLTAATGMNRPSLKSAFGDKRTIYMLALERFRLETREMLSSFERSEGNVEEALLDLFHHAIELFRGGSGKPSGCPILCTAPAEAGVDAKIRALCRSVLLEVDRELAAGLMRLETGWIEVFVLRPCSGHAL